MKIFSLAGCAVQMISYGKSDPKTSLVAVNGRSAESWKLQSGITVATLNVTGKGCDILESKQFANELSGAVAFKDCLSNLASGKLT